MLPQNHVNYYRKDTSTITKSKSRFKLQALSKSQTQEALCFKESKIDDENGKKKVSNSTGTRVI